MSQYQNQLVTAQQFQNQTATESRYPRQSATVSQYQNQTEPESPYQWVSASGRWGSGSAQGPWAAATRHFPKTQRMAGPSSSIAHQGAEAPHPLPPTGQVPEQAAGVAGRAGPAARLQGTHRLCPL